jgi:hypothetical protein
LQHPLTESTARQYALRDRALALGWPAERVMVIDQDLGHSGASAADRAGFQRPVAVGKLMKQLLEHPGPHPCMGIQGDGIDVPRA